MLLRRRLIVILLGTVAAHAAAREPATAEATSMPTPDPSVAVPAKPAIERIDDTHFRIGAVTFDHQTREIRFPAAVNMTEGNLEYAIVKSTGKVHESLLVSTISATHLNLAFALLNYPGKDNDDDTVWVPFPKRVPPEGTKVSVRIAPNPDTTP
ncbi:MAG: hypothetical protein NTW21_06295 [Verrucomicrobia bacterium]|nr:hypothetical protein [Verrucomicrobiota bacterium]